MNAGQLKRLIANVPDSTPVHYADPNFGGLLNSSYKTIEVDDFIFTKYTPLSMDILLINIPCVEEIE